MRPFSAGSLTVASMWRASLSHPSSEHPLRIQGATAHSTAVPDVSHPSLTYCLSACVLCGSWEESRFRKGWVLGIHAIETLMTPAVSSPKAARQLSLSPGPAGQPGPAKGSGETAVSSTTQVVAGGPSDCGTRDDAVNGRSEAGFGGTRGPVRREAVACKHSAECLRLGHARLCVRTTEETDPGVLVSPQASESPCRDMGAGDWL